MQNIVHGSVHNTAPVFLNKGGHYLAIGCKGSDGTILILVHKTAIPNNIGTEYCCESSLEVFCGHVVNFLYLIFICTFEIPIKVTTTRSIQLL